MQTVTISTTQPDCIEHALTVLAKGGLVAFPTDTVYGLAASLTNSAGIDRLYEAKARSTNKAIAVLIGDPSQLEQVTVGLTETARKLADRFWPGALTLVAPKHPKLPENLSPLPTVGIRMPDHPFALALMRAAGPLAVTSANISGEANTVTAAQVLEQLNGRIELMLDGGATPGGVPSTVVDCTIDPPGVLREGAITIGQVKDALNRKS